MIADYGARLTDLADPIACNYATLRCGLSYETHWLSYIRWLLAALEQRAAGAGGRGSDPAVTS